MIFLKEILELANKYKMMLLDRIGNLFNPDFNEMKKYIKISNNFKFIKNPQKFLEDLNNGEIRIE